MVVWDRCSLDALILYSCHAVSMALKPCEKAQDKAKKMLALAGDRMHSDLGRLADFFIPK